MAGRVGQRATGPGRPLPAADEAMLPSFVLLRRLLLLAWMGSHSHSRESQAMSITYAAGSCDTRRALPDLRRPLD